MLENWSLFTALEDLCEGPCGFLADWKADHPAEFRKFRSLLIDLVLATDM